MLKISDAVRHIVDAHPYLRTALAQRVLNLSQVARHIHASVEARTHKPVQTAAITMSLSRLQAQLPDLDAGPPLRLARRITVQRDLAVVTFPNTPRVQEGLLRVQERVRRSRGYLTISEGIRGSRSSRRRTASPSCRRWCRTAPPARRPGWPPFR